MGKPRSSTALDVEIGKRIKAHRILAGMSQASLGDKLGLTFQQVQKYEKGRNKVAASRLPAIADALGTNVDALLDPHGVPSGVTTMLADLISTTHGAWLAKAFLLLSPAKQRTLVTIAELLK